MLVLPVSSPTRASFNCTSASMAFGGKVVNIRKGRATFSAAVIELHSAPLWNSTPKRRPSAVRRASGAAQ